MPWTPKDQTPRLAEGDVLLTYDFTDPEEVLAPCVYSIAANSQTDTKRLAEKVEACYVRWLATGDTHPLSAEDSGKMASLKQAAATLANVKQTSGKG